MFKPKQFKLDSRGLGKILGTLEAKVMEVVWHRGSATVREMCDSVSDKSLSFNTLMTIMNRLVEKNLLKKKNVDGSYSYYPACERQDFLASVSSDIARSLIKDPLIFSLAAFVETLEDDPEKMAELKKLISKK